MRTGIFLCIMNVLAYLLMLSELVHVILHTQVLLGFGKLYTVDELEKKRGYFILDMGTTLLSFFYITSKDFSCLCLFLTLGHAVLHLYYIAKWTMHESFFSSSIREYSAQPNHGKRMRKDGFVMYAWNTIGTAFDIYVHLFMLQTVYAIM